jgi:hypothetical protein
LQAAIQSASGGSTICLGSGSYGAVTLSSVAKALDVTVQPVAGSTVTVGFVKLNAVSHVRFTGLGGTMTMAGAQVDANGPCSASLTFDHITYTAGVDVIPRCANQAITLDHDTFDNIGQAGWEGRVNVQSLDQGVALPNGVTISNSHFGGETSGANCSDGIDVLGGGYGTVISGNEFTNIHQSGCTAHVDPIQLYGSSHTTITGNYFHDNGDGSGGMMTDSGDDDVTVTNNVFVCTCIYPDSIVVRGGDRWLIQHNTFAGGGDVRMGNSTGPNPTNNIVRDNVFTGAGGILNLCNCNWGTHDHNLNSDFSGTGEITGTPVFVGGGSYAGYHLAAGSPGKGAASDGTDMGIG